MNACPLPGSPAIVVTHTDMADITVIKIQIQIFECLGKVFPVTYYSNKGAPNHLFVKVQRNNFSLEMLNKYAAGTAQETVGQPGTQIPMIANKINKQPIDT